MFQLGFRFYISRPYLENGNCRYKVVLSVFGNGLWRGVYTEMNVNETKRKRGKKVLLFDHLYTFFTLPYNFDSKFKV